MKSKTPAYVQRRRSESQRVANTQTSVPQQSKADLWLVRFGYIAQVGALVATVFGFYFTVIPLYQKAVLDELIAQREVDLKNAQKDIALAKREAYEQRRLNFTQQLARSAADRCAETRLSIGQPGIKESRAVRHERIVNLSLEVSSCLTSASELNKATSVLTKSDHDFLAQLLANTGKALDDKRREALENIASLPRRAVADPSVLQPVGEYVSQAYEFQDRASSILNRPISKDVLDERFRFQVMVSQEALAYEYRMGAFKTILTAIRDVKWPKPDSPT
ncbi:hypothetical protein [Variovorax sp. tm]|uniref:hypothetical protein n=1 Tax=Variovorax atrisoli TaxID=3394203 RepID=UPI003A812246